MIARHARDFTWNRGCSSNSPPLTHGDQIPHPLEDSDNQIPSSPGIARGEDVEASIWPIHYGYIMYGNMICQHALLGKQLRFNHRISFKTHHEKSAVIMMGIVIGVFVVCYGIYLRCSLLVVFDTNASCKDEQYKIPVLVLNSAINPLSYAFFKRDIKKEFKRLISQVV